MQLAWPKRVVEENNLQVQVVTLRKLLGPAAITTIPGRGYQFTAPLDGAAPASAQPKLAVEAASPLRRLRPTCRLSCSHCTAAMTTSRD